MNEKLLQYIWRFQYFNKSDLTTTDGDAVTVINAGMHNTNQGPDFSSARIKIGDTIWAGNVELHVNSSDWRMHGHDDDSNYRNIILHVVWINDTALRVNFPVLELNGRVSRFLLEKYHCLMLSSTAIPCHPQIAQVNELVWTGWKQRLLIERMLAKSQLVLRHLAATGNHWEETFWRMLARNFGVKVNMDALENIAVTVPVALLAKHKNQLLQLEALLLGQAGILNASFKDDYCIMLQKEYRYLQKKYGLVQSQVPVHYLRMRPSAFPSLRLAQLAMLVHRSAHLFSSILETTAVQAIKKKLDVTANDYWHYHYTPGVPSSRKEKKLGSGMIDNIIINTIAPVLFAYGHYKNENTCKEKALAWLEATAPEKNSILKGFSKAGIRCRSAFDSQALLQLKNNYCDQKRCLECAAGNAILKKDQLVASAFR